MARTELERKISCFHPLFVSQGMRTGSCQSLQTLQSEAVTILVDRRAGEDRS